MIQSVCRAAAGVAALLGVSSVTPGQPLGAPVSPVRIEVVASAPDASAPAAAWLGVRFVVEKGWHIYWQNPGDSGGAPEVTWTLPAGLQAGPLQWPVPERIPLDSLVNYGYHGDVVLPARLTPAQGRWPAQGFTVTAQVKWLVCKDICIPGKGEASLLVPTGVKVPDPAGESIRRALARLPRPAPRTWRFSGRAEGDTFAVSIETGARETGAEFFPLVPGQIDPSVPARASPTPRGIELVLRKSDYLDKPIASLRGVIVLPGGRAHEIDVPVR